MKLFRWKIVTFLCIIMVSAVGIAFAAEVMSRKVSPITNMIETREHLEVTPMYTLQINASEKNPEANVAREPQPDQPELMPTTTLSVYPGVIMPSIGEIFTINVTISNVTNLRGYEFWLKYNTSALTATEIIVGDFFPDFCVIKKEIYQVKRCLWIAVILPLGVKQGMNGNGTLATIKFKAEYTGSCILNLTDTKLARKEGMRIPHKVEDGYFECKIHVHDLVVSLSAPGHLEPGESSILNATVINKGLFEEANVQLQLLIDDIMVDSTTIPSFPVGISYTLSYLWAPAIERTFNVTAFVMPVADEDRISNNAISKSVLVRPPIRVPEDYPTIREAVGSAVSGEVIFVASGVYYEQSLSIDKPVKLIGENSNNTIIDGDGTREMIIYIAADNVNISGFTIRNGFGGVLFDHSNSSSFVGNIITNTHDCLSLLFSYECNIARNTMRNNTHGITLGSSNHNSIYHNNFIDNPVQVWQLNSVNIWDNGKGQGNHWSNYNGTDLDGDGVGDEYLPWELVDYHPLICPVTFVDTQLIFKTSE